MEKSSRHVHQHRDRPLELRSDEVVEELRCLVPELSVAGGSFAHCLPAPASLPRSKRHAVWKVARDDAVEGCLKHMVGATGLPAVEPPRSPAGSRLWPAGYVGSVSHRGTRVVAALGRRTSIGLVGIDIDDRRGIELPTGLPCEQPLAVSADWGSAILFSTKEAVFKALHPVLGQPLGFGDVMMSWTTGPPLLLGTARCRGHRLAVRCSLSVPSWTVSAAVRLVEIDGEHNLRRETPPRGQHSRYIRTKVGTTQR